MLVLCKLDPPFELTAWVHQKIRTAILAYQEKIGSAFWILAF
jgi:hypothetical protein